MYIYINPQQPIPVGHGAKVVGPEKKKKMSGVMFVPVQLTQPWGGGGAQRENLLSKAMVKHDRAWPPHGWVTVSCWGYARRLLALYRLYYTPQKSFGGDYKTRSHVYMHAKRSHTHVKDPLLHFRVR